MYQRISELVEFLDRVEAKPVLLIGDFMLDEYLYGDAERISPEAPVPVLRVRDRARRLGGAGSVAASLLGLGCPTWCAGVIGADATGDAVTDMLAQTGADVSGLVRDSSIVTPLKQRLIGLAQHRNPQQLARVDHERVTPYSASVMDQFKRRVAKILPTASVVAVQDHNKGLVSETLFGWLVAEAKSHGVPVFVDPALIGDYERYRGATVVTPNRFEASLASGVEIDSAQRANEVGKTLCKRFEFGSAMITLDADGVCLVDRDRCEHIPTERQDVVDVTGAGDVVLATVVFAAAGRLDLSGAGTLANVAGGWEVQQAAVAPITRAQLQWELLHRHRRHRGKVVDRTNLVRELEILREHGTRIVLTNGCFDLLHPGHITSFEFAREQGDLLVVGLNSDRSARTLKGASRPLINQTDRARMIAALEAVDYVVIFDDESVLSLVEDVRPDVLVKGRKGRDRTTAGVVGAEFVEKHGGKVVLAPIETEHSTSGVIEAIIAGASAGSSKEVNTK